MALLIGPQVWPTITAAARSTTAAGHAAVAYFAQEGPAILPLRSGSTLVVDASIETVSSGGTSPMALRTMLHRGVQIYSAQNLHAKVIAFNERAFIGSANASRNSARYLIEAVASFEESAMIASAHEFIRGLAITELGESDLAELAKLYRAPKPPKFPARQTQFTTLIMELTREQGAGRETQVQPPRPVWETYFGIDFTTTSFPRLRLSNIGPPTTGVATGVISKHHHNLTLELPGAEMPRPAILEVRKVGPRTFDYQVHRTGAVFDRMRALLQARSNPLWTSGRKWLII